MICEGNTGAAGEMKLFGCISLVFCFISQHQSMNQYLIRGLAIKRQNINNFQRRFFYIIQRRSNRQKRGPIIEYSDYLF
jgi:hypothetical protein